MATLGSQTLEQLKTRVELLQKMRDLLDRLIVGAMLAVIEKEDETR